MGVRLAPSSPVYVSQSQRNPGIFHTSLDCPRMPAAYDTLALSLAEEQDLRICSNCYAARFDGLEL